MARTTPAGERWAEWLNAQLELRGWRQVDLLDALGDDAPTRQTVNSWVNGQFAAGGDMAFAVGEVLGSPADAMRAAGCPRIAKALEDRPPQAATAPTPAEQLSEFEAGLRAIKARGHPPKREAEAIADFTRRANRMVEAVLEDFRGETAEARASRTG